MNEFKVNLNFKENGKNLEEIMEGLFIIFIKNKLTSYCKNFENELKYVMDN